MKRTMIFLACAAGMAGCATDGFRSGARVPANPPDFTAASPAKADEARALAVERDNLAQTITELRGEVAQLRQLFRMQNTPLEGERRRATGDVFSQTAPQPIAPAVQVSRATASIAPPSTAPVAAPMAAPSPAVRTPAVAAAAIAPATVSAAVAKPQTPASYTALFKFASAALDDTSRAALAAIRPQLLGAQKVSLNAYADTVGDAGANAKLASARAAAIEQELVKLGVAKDRIEVVAKVADSRPAEGVTILGLFRSPDAFSRRVDLALLSSRTVQ